MQPANGLRTLGLDANAVFAGALLTVACQSVGEYGIGTPCDPDTPCRLPLICEYSRCALKTDQSSGGVAQSTSAAGTTQTMTDGFTGGQSAVGGTAQTGGASCCGDSSPSGGATSSRAGTPPTTSVIEATGGVRGSGGASAAAGANTSGGENSSGGANSSPTGTTLETSVIEATGGVSGSGGASAAGGANTSGGANTTGGVDTSGGANTTGGASAAGGANTSGGANTTGGAVTGGVDTSGGATPAGGAGPGGGVDASGGVNASGGSNPVSGGTAGSAGSFISGSGGGTAVAQRPIGAQCEQDDQCTTLHCVDGFCCESKCDEQCNVCDAPGSEGYCTAQKSGLPKNGRVGCINEGSACGGSCKGQATCTYPVGNSCNEQPACIDAATRRDRLVCDDSGECSIPVTTACEAPQVCNLNIDAQCGARVISSVESSQVHTCTVMSDGELYCWGANDQGQLGWPSQSTGLYKMPQRVPEQSLVRSIALGHRHTCALYSDGRVACWGRNNNGQLGCTSPDTTSGINRCSVHVRNGVAVAQIAASGDQTCARYEDGTVQCWGLNDHGQLGNGSSVTSPEPVTVIDVANAVGMSVGVAHACALIADGTVKCWGGNAWGKLCDGTEEDRAIATKVVGIDGTSEADAAIAVSAGSTHTCILLATGAIECCGEATQLQFGGGTVESSDTPLLTTFAVPAQQVVAGIHFTCALVDPQRIQCMGTGDAGQLGDGGTATSATPVEVRLPSSVSFRAIVSKYDTTCAISTDGRLWCWGYNDNAQVGNLSTQHVLVPTQPYWSVTG